MQVTTRLCSGCSVLLCREVEDFVGGDRGSEERRLGKVRQGFGVGLIKSISIIAMCQALINKQGMVCGQPPGWI